MIVRGAAVLLLVVLSTVRPARADVDFHTLFHLRAGPVIGAGVDAGGALALRDIRHSPLELQLRMRGEADIRGWGAGLGIARSGLIDSNTNVVLSVASVELHVFHPWTSSTFPDTYFIGPEIHTSWAYVLGVFCGAYWSVHPIGGVRDQLLTCGYSLGYN
jgi:hypothetical protein